MFRSCGKNLFLKHTATCTQIAAEGISRFFQINTKSLRLREAMFEISKRLEQANQAANPREHLEEEREKAGRNGEISFASSLRLKGGLDNFSVFCCLRIPDKYQSRKREIDVVVLTGDGIFCFEIKCWRGHVTASDDQTKWIQTSSKKIDTNSFATNHIEHENSVKETQIKALLLKEHLSRQEIFIAEKFFHSRVVFVNPNVQLDDNIANNPAVVKPNERDRLFNSFNQGYLAILEDAILPSWISGKLSYSQMNEIRKVLSSTGTWDIVELNGGKRLYGDFKECAGIFLNRQKCEALVFTHQRNRTVGMAWALLGYIPQVSVSLLERGGNGWIWNSYCASVKIPYNSEVIFRICGDESDSRIPANDIDKISISI